MTIFVERDNGKIVGIYQNKQDGYAEEELADDNQEVLDFLAPNPAPRLVLKRVIIDRLYAAGKLEAARAALNASSLYTQERWNARDAIYANDPDALALLAAIKADPTVIMAG